MLVRISQTAIVCVCVCVCWWNKDLFWQWRWIRLRPSVSLHSLPPPSLPGGGVTNHHDKQKQHMSPPPRLASTRTPKQTQTLFTIKHHSSITAPPHLHHNKTVNVSERLQTNTTRRRISEIQTLRNKSWFLQTSLILKPLTSHAGSSQVICDLNRICFKLATENWSKSNRSSKWSDQNQNIMTRPCRAPERSVFWRDAAVVKVLHNQERKFGLVHPLFVSLKCGLHHVVIMDLFGHDNRVIYLYCYFYFLFLSFFFISYLCSSCCCDRVFLSLHVSVGCSLVSATSPDFLFCSLEGSEPTQTLYRLLSGCVQLQSHIKHSPGTRQNQTEPAGCHCSSNSTRSALSILLNTNIIIIYSIR